MLHSLARGTVSLGGIVNLIGNRGSRQLAGRSQIKVVAEWFPPKNARSPRASFNSGSALGAVVPPPLAPVDRH